MSSSGFRGPTPMTEKTVTVDGVRLCVETFGSPVDPAVLLVAGIGGLLFANGMGLMRLTKRRETDDDE